MMVLSERRKPQGAMRIPFDRKVEVETSSKERAMVGYAQNLSMRGMSVVGGVHLAPHTRVRLGFALDDGGVFHAQARVVRAIEDKLNGEGVGLLFEEVDETHQRALEAIIDSYPSRERFVQFSMLSEKILKGVTVTEILDHVYESFRFLIPYDRIGFAKLDESGRVLHSMWARSDGSALKIPIGYTGDLKGSSLNSVLRSGEARIINDLSAYLAEHPHSDSTRRIVAEGMMASLTCPLVAFQRPMGFLFFSSRHKEIYQRAHVETFRFLATQISYAIEKGFLFEELMATKKRLEAANRNLLELSTVDALTGVRNRRYFDQRLEEEWHRSTRTHQFLSLVMLDVDHFKQFNDLYGHAEGDGCLKKIGEALRCLFRRPTEFVARYGGEEFAVLLAHTSADQAMMMANRLREKIVALSIPHEGNTPYGKVTASVGVSTLLPSKNLLSQELITEADQALYRAKHGGRNCVQAANQNADRYAI